MEDFYLILRHFQSKCISNEERYLFVLLKPDGSPLEQGQSVLRFLLF